MLQAFASNRIQWIFLFWGLVLCQVATNTHARSAHASQAYALQNNTKSPITILQSYNNLPIVEYISGSDETLINASLADIHRSRSLEWETLWDEVPNLGFTQDVGIFRFRVTNHATTEQQYVLYIDYPLLDHLEFFAVSPLETVQYPITGDRHPFSSRPVDNRGFVFPFSVQPGEIKTLYLRAQATDTLQIPLHLYEAETFRSMTDSEKYIWGIYYGIIGAMLVFTFFLFIIMKDQPLIFYVTFVASYIIVSMGLNGFLNSWLFPNYPDVAKTIRAVFLGVGLGTCILFSIDFLKTEIYTPKLHRWMKGCCVAAFITVALSLLIPFYYAIQITLLTILFSAVIMICCGFITWSNGYTPAKFYSIAWVCFFLGGFANLFRAFAWIPTNFITEYGVQIGSVINVLLLALGIAYRFDMERKMLFLAEKRALTNEKLVQDEKEHRLKAQLLAQEEQLISEKARAEARAKSQFLANMSHEIRTPMNGVLGMVQLLRDTTLNYQQSQYVKTIENSGNALLRIINDILDFSKIEAGKMSMEFIPFHLVDLIDECTSIFSLSAAEQDLRFEIYIDPTLPTHICSDPTRIKQIILNLFSNAFKFTHSGYVRLTVSYQNNSHQLLRFEVQDSGVGLSPQQLETLFSSFVQADSSTTRRYGGTGLGLSICQRLTQLLGGEIGVESEEKSGSTFWFNISLDRIVALPENHEKEYLYQSVRDKRFIISTTDESLFKHLAKHIAHWNGTAIYISSPAELVSLLKSEKRNHDYIIVDQPMLDESVMSKLLAPTLASARVMILSSPTNLDKLADLPDNIGILEYPITFNKLEKHLLVTPEHLAHKESEKQHRSFKQLNVLVVEDNKVNQMVIRGMLNKLNIQPAIANHGKAAVEEFERDSSFQCIIMDCEMPEMDGYEATRRIRLSTGSSHKPYIIGLSANAMKEHEERALASGMNIYLRKPVQFEEVCEALLQEFPTFIE